MSVLNMNLDMTISSVVEAMLPRFSDRNLGLLVSLDLSFDDYGFGADGNTQEREALHVRRFPHLLFVRPSNYTQVYIYEGEVGKMARGPLTGSSSTLKWKQTSDHDSCWRTDGFSDLVDIYFECCHQFTGREVTGKPLRPCDVKTFHHFLSDPKYVRLTTHEQSDKEAERYSKESRIYDIQMEGVDRDELETVAYREKDLNGRVRKFMTGVMVKGSEDHSNSIARRNHNDERFGE